MMEVLAPVDELLEKIHATGYWRVNIRPTVFEEHRIASLDDCRDIIDSSQVTLRLWKYPHIEPLLIANGSDWIENRTVPIDQQVGYWRFYQSAQFVHHFTLHEHRFNYSEESRYRLPEGLDMLHTLFTMTEVFEFAARLAEKRLLRPSAEISIKLSNASGRYLWLPNQHLNPRLHTGTVDEIPIRETVSEEELIARRSELALDAAIHVFEVFNWDNPSREILAEDQRKFLERRL